MNEINSKRIIGRVRSRKNMLCWMIVLIGLPAYALWSVFGVFNPQEMSRLPIYMGNEQIVYVLFYILILGWIWVVISTMLFLGSNQFIQIDSKNFSYCEARGLRGKMRQFINTLFQRPQSFDLQIHISEIKNIRLSFSDEYFWFILKGHALIYDIELHDGTLIRILPQNLYLKKENVLLGITYMENLKIVVDDPYHIKEALENKSVVLGEYLDRLEKEHAS